MSTVVIGAARYGTTAPRTPSRGAAGTAQPRLRLTKRGRGVLMTLAATPIVIAAFFFTLNGGGATASLGGSQVAFEYVSVESGQGLWQLAETLAPTADPRDVIDAIVRLNQLESTDVYAGQELAIPAQYLP